MGLGDPKWESFRGRKGGGQDPREYHTGLGRGCLLVVAGLEQEVGASWKEMHSHPAPPWSSECRVTGPAGTLLGSRGGAGSWARISLRSQQAVSEVPLHR